MAQANDRSQAGSRSQLGGDAVEHAPRRTRRIGQMLVRARPDVATGRGFKSVSECFIESCSLVDRFHQAKGVMREVQVAVSYTHLTLPTIYSV